MTANSFSTATTFPLMTEPSCKFPPPKDSSSSLAKSSREGAVAVAMESPVRGRAGGLNGVPNARAEGPADLRRPPESRTAGAKTVLSERWFAGALYAEARAGLCPPTRGVVSHALGPPGWPRRCRWRPGWPRLYPNVSYRASARPKRVLKGRPPGSGRVDLACEYPPAPPLHRYCGLAPGIRRHGDGRAPRVSR